MIYKNFSKYVLRAPLFSFSFYKNLTRDATISDEELIKVCSNKIIKEAIFLASPSLYTEFEKWMNGEIKDKDKSDRLRSSVLKYISRMSSRCTPFGLFAGTSVGEFSEETNIELQHKSKNKRHTRLDMNYLVALSQDIVKNETIREQLLFYPNTSIYKTGPQFRYVEYTYLNSKRIHHIIGVGHSDYLEEILTKATKGALLNDLAELLVDDEISIEEAKEFIHQLVESQLLISELEPSVSGPEFLDQLLPVLKRIDGTEQIISALEETQNILKKLDSSIGNEAEQYIQLSESLKKLEVGFEIKFMFQTDMSLSPKANTLDKKYLHKVRKAMMLLNKMSLPQNETLLSAFKTAFYERYEDREVPLSKALDVELGVGFLQNNGDGDVSKIIDDLILPHKDNGVESKDIRWSPIHSMLQRKLLECIAKNKNTITITDDDVKDFQENWEDLPDTISSMIEIVAIDGEEKIIMSSAGGSSAANLLGRFCHGDSELYRHSQEIVNVEQLVNPDKILAEIVHLPESRVGNILMRPKFRKYEIPYLAKSIVDSNDQLPIDDLMISASSKGKIKLRSKKYDKEVLPHLTNAHNYSSNSLPIYQFLANMQTQNTRSGIGFNWGPLEDEYDFLPRVEYGGVLLSIATWNIRITEIQQIIDHYNDEDQFMAKLELFLSLKRLPQFVLLVDGDNELLVNTKNLSSSRMLIGTVKKRSAFRLKEFLHSEHGGIVKEAEETYTNQIVLSFYNDKKLKNTNKL